MAGKRQPRGRLASWLWILPALVIGPLLGIVLARACEDSGGSGPTPSPSPSPLPITAEGTIGYITPDGDFALMNPDGSDQRVLTQGGGITAFSWSPDGSIAALVSGSGLASRLRAIHPDGSIAFEAEGGQPLWSPDGALLALTRGDDLAVLDSAGQDVRLFPGAQRPEWSPDRSRLAFLRTGADGMAVPEIGTLESGETVPLSQDIAPAEPTYPISWHPAGAVVAYRNKLYDLTTGVVQELPGTAVEWSPDGRMLVVAGEFSATDNATTGMLLDASQELKQTIGFYIRPSAEDIPAWNFIQKWTDWTPNGRYFLYLDPEPQRQRVRLYDTVAVTQDIHRNIAGERPDISPDGTHATFVYEGHVWAYPLDASTLARIAPGDAPAWQP